MVVVLRCLLIVIDSAIVVGCRHHCLCGICHGIFRWFRGLKRGQFIKKHWPDLVAAIPLSESFRFLRLIRILRIRRLFNPVYRERLRTMWTTQRRSRLFLCW